MTTDAISANTAHRAPGGYRAPQEKPAQDRHKWPPPQYREKIVQPGWLNVGRQRGGAAHTGADSASARNAAIRIYTAMPLVRNLAIRCMRVRYPDSHIRFAATPEESAAEFAQMERDGLKPIRVTGP